MVILLDPGYFCTLALAWHISPSLLEKLLISAESPRISPSISNAHCGAFTSKLMFGTGGSVSEMVTNGMVRLFKVVGILYESDSTITDFLGNKHVLELDEVVDDLLFFVNLNKF